jgi:formylglycine-generating enzyme required for sulfatase activity
MTNGYAIYGCYYDGSGTCTGVTNLAPVGTAFQGAGYWGQLDLAGEVYEWNLDWYAGYAAACTDCAYLTAASDRAIRGGPFSGLTTVLLPPFRGVNAPAGRYDYLGFRCARTP